MAYGQQGCPSTQMTGEGGVVGERFACCCCCRPLAATPTATESTPAANRPIAATTTAAISRILFLVFPDGWEIDFDIKQTKNVPRPRGGEGGVERRLWW